MMQAQVKEVPLSFLIDILTLSEVSDDVADCLLMSGF